MPDLEWETITSGDDVRTLASVPGREGDPYLPLWRVIVDLGPAVGTAQATEGLWRPALEAAIRQRLPYAGVSVSYEGSSLVVVVDGRGPQPTLAVLPFIGAVLAVAIGIVLTALGLAYAYYLFQQARLPATAATGLEKLVDNPWFPLAVFVIAAIALTR